MSSNPLYLIPAHTDIEAIKQRYGRCIADKKKARKKALLTYSGRGRLSILQIYNDDIDELYNEQNRTVKSARESNAAEKTTTQQNYFLLLTMAIVILSMPIITTNWWNE